MADFPIADHKHKISNAAKAALSDVQPASWNVDLIDGDNDFGLDAFVQVEVHGQIRYSFKVQLKGTESPKYSADQSLLSVGLKRTTLNYYANQNDEVLLIVAVVVLKDNGKLDRSLTKVYWNWITAELRKLRGSRYSIDASSQSDVTVHVPLENQLTPSSDVQINAHLDERLRIARAAEKLEDILRGEGDVSRTRNPLEQLASIDHNRLRQFLSAISEEPVFAGMESTGSAKVDALYAEGIGYIRAGSTDLAERFLESLDRSWFEATGQTKALLRSLEGKVAMQRMQRELALSYFKEAYSSDPCERHLLPWEEVRFLAAIDANDVAVIQEVSQSLAGVTTDEGLALLVRVYASIRKFTEAESCVQRISIQKQIVPRLVLLSAMGKSDDAYITATKALRESNLSPQDKVAVTLVAARECWQGALASAHVDPNAKELPINGAPGLDRTAASKACDLCICCLEDLKKAGWSVNVEFVAPIAVASSCAVGRQSEIVRLLREAAIARPAYPELQAAVEVLGVSIGDLALALEANARLPSSHGTLARRACLLFQSRKFEECLSFALQACRTDGAICAQTPMAYAAGSAAASLLARPEDQTTLLSLLSSREEWCPFVHFARFAEAGTTGGIAEAVTYLRQGFKQFPDSWLLAANLFSNLDVSVVEEAREAISVARLLRRYSNLAAREWTQLISAYITVQHWQEAERETLEAIAQYGEQERFVSSLAIAAEMQGRTGEAVRALERFVALGHRRSGALRNYLGLCLRLGRMSVALQTIGQLLEQERDREERIELMRLRALILVQQGSAEEARDVTMALGRVVDRESEAEEGLFINLFMAVTVEGGSNPSAAQLSEFQGRMEAFCSKWPESTAFRRLVVPETPVAGPEALFDMLDKITGDDSRARMKEFHFRERQARAGNLPVPFVLRPGFVLHYVSDPFTLWSYSKKSDSNDKQFHLTCNLLDEPPSNLRSFRRVPLLDLTALFILHDLELLGLVLAVFRRIAVPSRTVDYLSQQSRSMIASPASKRLASRLLDWVNENLSRIEQPSEDKALMKFVQARDVVEDYVSLAKTKRWLVYTDDAILRAWIRSDAGQIDAISTLDVLSFADTSGDIQPEDVSGHLATLVSWNVGVTVSGRYLVAALHGAVSDGSYMSAGQRLDAFQSHEPFAKLARAIWFPGKGAHDLIIHMTSVLVEILGRSGSNDNSVAALWGFWAIRIRLDPEVSSTGIDPLAASLVGTLRALPIASASRAISIYKTAIEITAGEDTMSQSFHDQAIVRLSRYIGSLTSRNPKIAEDLRAKVATAFVAGTTDGDLFDSGYFESQRSALDRDSKYFTSAGKQRE